MLNVPQMHGCKSNIGSGNDLTPSSIKPILESILSEISLILNNKAHMASQISEKSTLLVYDNVKNIMSLFTTYSSSFEQLVSKGYNELIKQVWFDET